MDAECICLSIYFATVNKSYKQGQSSPNFLTSLYCLTLTVFCQPKKINNLFRLQISDFCLGKKKICEFSKIAVV